MTDYPLVYDTKVVKIDDENLFFFRKESTVSAGRKQYGGRNYFIGTVMSKKEYMDMVRHYAGSDKPFGVGCFNDRDEDYYSQHLIRMYKRAMEWDEFNNRYCFQVNKLIGMKKNTRKYSLEEWKNIKVKDSDYVREVYDTTSDLLESIKMITNNNEENPVKCYIEERLFPKCRVS